MGIYYDQAHSCWRLDYPARINGKSTHLKATVHGPQRKTQREAFDKWGELEDRARDPKGSLTFREDAEKYIADHPEIAANLLRVISTVIDGIGSVRVRDIEAAGKEWIERQEKRISAKTRKPLSPATIQSYKRYIKCILRHCGHGNYWKEIKIGKVIARQRPIAPWEMLELERVIMEVYPWFYPAFDFARCCPIRPEDQFALTAERNVEHDPFKVKYFAKKTKTEAHPIIQPNQRSYFQERKGLIFCRQNGKTLYSGPGNAYYDFIWGKICGSAGIRGCNFYDLRHNAVAYLRSQGVEDWRIVKAAGWKGPEMLKIYDPDNEHLIAEYDKKHFCSTESSTGSQVVNDFHRENF